MDEDDYRRELDEQARLEQQIQQLEMLVRSRFTKGALERFGALKSAHPEKAVQVLLILGQLIDAGKAKTVDENQLRELLSHISPRRDFKIQRK